LLLDADINPELERVLQAVGFATESALRIGIDVRDDTALLRWARKNRYILVCHDRHRDRRTNQQFYPEIYHRGGRVIQISGDSGQDLLTALGKVLVHREKWRDFFKDNDGIATVTQASGVKLDPAEKLYARIQRRMEGMGDAAKSLKHRKPPRPRKRMPTRKQKPPEQLYLGEKLSP
jgi:hypothetical protein